MKELVMNPAVWGPSLAFIGLVIGHLTAGWGKKKDHELAALQTSVEVLRAEYKRLNDEVRELRTEVDTARAEADVAHKGKRKVEEKLSAWISWHGLVTMRWEGLRLRLDAAGVEYGEFPALPRLLAVDMEPTPR